MSSSSSLGFRRNLNKILSKMYDYISYWGRGGGKVLKKYNRTDNGLEIYISRADAIKIASKKGYQLIVLYFALHNIQLSESQLRRIPILHWILSSRYLQTSFTITFLVAPICNYFNNYLCRIRKIMDWISHFLIFQKISENWGRRGKKKKKRTFKNFKNGGYFIISHILSAKIREIRLNIFVPFATSL